MQEFKYSLSHYWANDDQVRKALHIREVEEDTLFVFETLMLNILNLLRFSLLIGKYWRMDKMYE